MNKQIEARRILGLYAPQVRWTVDYVMDRFELESAFKDDIRQEAEILLITYAGLINRHVAYEGQLHRWAKKVDNDPVRLKAIVGYNLRVNLAKYASRMIHRTGDESMHPRLDIGDAERGEYPLWDKALYRPKYLLPSSDSFIQVSNGMTEQEIRENYPYLALLILDGLTWRQIRDKRPEGKQVSRATVARRFSTEKRRFLEDLITSKGLIVEGDESLDELAEALHHANTGDSDSMNYSYGHNGRGIAEVRWDYAAGCHEGRH
jgi:hypothetical protein